MPHLKPFLHDRKRFGIKRQPFGSRGVISAGGSRKSRAGYEFLVIDREEVAEYRLESSV
jgi:hypothetical protein